MQLKSNYKTFDLLEASERDEMMAGHRRKVLTLVLNGTTYADVAAALTDGATLTIVDEQGHDNVITDRTKAGAITDNRDGTITAKMGASNTVEQDLQDEVTSKTQIITAIAGKTVQTTEEAAAVRADVESLFVASTMDDDGKISASYLCKEWQPETTKRVRCTTPAARRGRCTSPTTTVRTRISFPATNLGRCLIARCTERLRRPHVLGSSRSMERPICITPANT